MVLNTVDAIEHMLLWSRDWTHFVNLSGNCYPLLLPGDLAAALAEASVSSAGAPLDVSFVSFWDPVLRWKMLSLDPALSGNATHGSIWQPGMEFSPLPYPYDGVIPYPFEPAVPVPHGDAWVILSRAFCASLFRNGRELRRLLAFFSTVPSPAEHFFQAWIRWTQAGLQLNATVAPDALRFFDFPPLSQHPAPMTRREQLEAAVEAGAAFARKFPEGSPLLDAVDGMSAEERGRARRNAVRRMRWAVEKTLAYGEPVR
ncbi:hypothetical protein DFJ74DRAFT_672831 [Hyaloraphidium curvatum]|nr:hypothetical protein DFJ74DRAFT_672831 [Hyaloraphidium curvatum]